MARSGFDAVPLRPAARLPSARSLGTGVADDDALSPRSLAEPERVTATRLPVVRRGRVRAADGFFAVEWRATSTLSVLVQTAVASRLVTNLVDYPGLHWYVMVGGKLDLGGGWRLTAGLTENLADQQGNGDVSFWTSLEVEF